MCYLQHVVVQHIHQAMLHELAAPLANIAEFMVLGRWGTAHQHLNLLHQCTQRSCILYSKVLAAQCSKLPQGALIFTGMGGCCRCMHVLTYRCDVPWIASDELMLVLQHGGMQAAGLRHILHSPWSGRVHFVNIRRQPRWQSAQGSALFEWLLFAEEGARVVNFAFAMCALSRGVVLSSATVVIAPCTHFAVGINYESCLVACSLPFNHFLLVGVRHPRTATTNFQCTSEAV